MNAHSLPYKILKPLEAGTIPWHVRRLDGLGGSDIAALLGFSPWKTALGLWQEKIDYDTSHSPPKEPMYWGSQLEPVIFEHYLKDHELSPSDPEVHSSVAVCNIERPYLRGNLDGLLLDVEIDGADRSWIVEVKTVGAFNQDKWWTEGYFSPPIHYALQAHHYMTITGYDECQFAVLIGGNAFYTTEEHHNPTLSRIIIEHAERFWNEHVQTQIPPQPDFVASTAKQDIDRLFPTSVPDRIIHLPFSYQRHLKEIQGFSSSMKELKTSRDTRRNEILYAMGNAQLATIDGESDYHLKRSFHRRGDKTHSRLTIRKGPPPRISSFAPHND